MMIGEDKRQTISNLSSTVNMPAASTSQRPKKHSRKGRQPYHKDSISSDEKLPGVQKLKASLRQTRRLLAKDTLAADTRIETERRLKSLEQDLAKAEATSKERNTATKYHKIKFFERQKVVRKIEQAKRSSGPDLQKKLDDLRVDLNYILHYPKAKKYISLFPSSSTAETDAERAKLREWIRESMDRGDLPKDPETRLSDSSKPQPSLPRGTLQSTTAVKPARKAGHAPQPTTSSSEDEFFGDDVSDNEQ
ncbi:hypothetical protein DL96DRAFT_1064508 [Flagelloscypha sp. PMI_526]|nr:hypothetical protein DL96DRAFT_1064508 [Flagelloscypha sp. PMI_526]